MQNFQEFKTFSDTLACSDRIDAANGQHLRRLHLLQQRGEGFVPWGISIIWEEKAFCLPIYVRYVAFHDAPLPFYIKGIVFRDTL